MVFLVQLLLVAGSVASAASAVALEPRQSSDHVASVDLTVTRGKPEHRASGFIYGIPDNFPNQIPLHWYTDMGITSCKGGGAQLTTVGYRGWVLGLNDYKGRFQSTLANYKTCRAAGAEFHIYVHDLWGTDHSDTNTKWPGDNGNWADYDKFVRQLMSDVAANMDPAHVVWDIWNEPDLTFFWKRSTQQWLDLWTRTHKLIRANPALNAMKISGPSLANRPTTTNTWWAAWLKQVASSKTIPDYYSYHLEGGTDDVTNDPQYTNSSLRTLLRQNGLPERQVHVNEYAISAEMVPGSYIWHISRLERYDFLGMLGNWLSGTQLHDLFGGLLTKRSNPADYAATDYAPTPGYPVYKYYNLNMTGLRATTTGSSDKWFDTYATVGTDRVRILAGTKLRTGTYSITVRGLDAVGYTSGSVPVTAYMFDGNSTKIIAPALVTMDTTHRNIVQNAITIPVSLANNYAGFAFEFPVRKRA